MEVERTLSGWRALGGLGPLVLVLAAVALVWAWFRPRRPSALWLVLAGGAALMVTMSETVDRVGGQTSGCCGLTTTIAPSAGLAVAYTAALAIILVGLFVLLQEARRRSQDG